MKIPTNGVAKEDLFEQMEAYRGSDLSWRDVEAELARRFGQPPRD